MRIWIARLFACVLLVSSLHAAAEAEDTVSLNFVDADIEEVIKAVAQITGKNFLIDPRVKGTISIMSTTPMPAPMAYDTLLSALRLQGYAVVESNGVTQVMPEADAKLHLARAGERGGGDKLVTRVYTLKHESAAQLVPILRPLIAPNNVVMAYPGNNALVVTDYASNLKRIEQIIDSIDQPQASPPVVIPVNHGSALDLAQVINRLMQEGGATGAAASQDSSQHFILLADARTNSLLLRTESASRVERVRELVGKLDQPSSAPGNIHVVYLKNAEATKLAQTLRSVLSGDTTVNSQANAPSGTATASTPGSQATASSSAAPSGVGMIQADAASNALIITAPDAVYNNLRAVVEMLDVRRAQVFVEALIAEVTADKAAEFGIQWQDLSGINRAGGNVIGGTNFGQSGVAGSGNIISASGSTAANNIGTAVGQGLNIGVVRGTTTIPGLGTVLNLGMLAKFLENDANGNILSTPNLLTLDNEEAKIIIGQNVPFITGTQNGTAANPNPFNTIERKDVGLMLRIKPQISQGGTVKLQVFQEVSSVQNNNTTGSSDLITNKRSLESTVLVDEGQIVVLGGLVQDSVTNGEDKVPLLGDIPLVGNLFRHETRRRTKTNLMVFIRPYVLRNGEAPQGLTQDRYEYLRGEQSKSQLPSRALLPDMPAPSMPPLSLKSERPAVRDAAQPPVVAPSQP